MGSISLQSDYQHWQQLRQGSPSALEAIYDKFFPELFRYGLQLVSDRSLVQDTLQDFFVELYTNAAQLSEVQQVRAYLYVCFRRKLLLRQKSVAFTPESQPLDFSPSPEHQLILQQLGEQQMNRLKEALLNLTDRQREAIFLRYYQDMGYEEIAEVLSLKKVKYARTLIYRTIAELRQHMTKHASSLTLYSTLFFISNRNTHYK
ncbi:MAG: RNA polymerase sigma factor [Bacteroidota bacterium]